MPTTVQELREQRGAKAKEARHLLDSTPDSGWADAVQQSYDGLVADIDRLDAQINNHQKIIDREGAALAGAQDRANVDGVSVDEANNRVEKDKGIFAAYCRDGADGLTADQREYVSNRAREIRSALGTGTAATGGVLAPDGFMSELLVTMKAYGGVRDLAQVMPTSNGNQIDWPTTDPTAEEGALVGENADVAELDTSFGTVAIGAYKYSSNSIAVPFELLQDSEVDIEAYIRDLLAMRIGRITNRHFTTGTGSGQPRGIVTASGLGVTAAAANAIGYDDLIDLEHSVDPAYRINVGVGYMFNDSTLRAFKKLKDTTGRPLWSPGIALSEPDLINGYRYSVNQHMADIGAGNISAVFGDFSKYLIRDVMQVLILRMADSAFALKGQVGFAAFSRHDGNLIAAGDDALKHLVH